MLMINVKKSGKGEDTQPTTFENIQVWRDGVGDVAEMYDLRRPTAHVLSTC